MLDECHYVVCLRCHACRRTAPASMAKTRIVRGTAGQFAFLAQQPEGCPWCGEREGEVRWGVLPRPATSYAMVAPAG